MDVIWLMVLVHSIAAMVMVCCRHIQLFCHNWLNKMALTLTHGCIFGGFPSWWYCTLCWDHQEWFLYRKRFTHESGNLIFLLQKYLKPESFLFSWYIWQLLIIYFALHKNVPFPLLLIVLLVIDNNYGL